MVLATTQLVGHGLEGEHLVRIKLHFDDGVLRLRDEFDWDLANPLNTYSSSIPA
jgi:hypothetical protein